MPRYVINHPYRSSRDGQTYGPWVKSDEVELSEAEASWLDRDSPGLLAPKRLAPVERQAEPTPNRMAKPTRNRGRK